MDELEK